MPNRADPQNSSLSGFLNQYPLTAGSGPPRWPGDLADITPPYNALKILDATPPVRQRLDTDLRPTNGFISALLGGPIPIRSASGATIGNYDHQAASLGIDAAGLAATVAPFVDPMLLDTLPEMAAAVGAGARAVVGMGARAATRPIARDAAEAIADGITHDHHLKPKYMGGEASGPTTPVPEQGHIDYHSEVRKLQKSRGILNYRRPEFPPVGGRRGSREDWQDYFEEHPARQDDAYTMLRMAAPKIDRQYGSSIGKELNRVDVLKSSEGRGRNMGILGIPLEGSEWWKSRKK